MEPKNENKITSTKEKDLVDKINLDYDYNTEYGDGDIPDVDKPQNEKDSQSR